MRFLILAALVAAMAVESRGQASKGFSVIPLAQEHEYAVAITVDPATEADEVIVTILYKVPLPSGFKSATGEMVISRTCVIPAMDAPVMTDSVPVGADKIFRVDVTLVKDIQKQQLQPEEIQ